MKVVGVTGMPGCGKTTLARMAEALGFKVVAMGDLVRAEAEKRGLKPDGETLRRLMVQLRAERGEDVLARLTVENVRRLKAERVLIDGVRSPAELEYFRKHFPDFKLIAVHTPQKLRFERLTGRRRSDDPSAWEAFVARDLRELEVGVGAAIALADRVIENLSSLEEFKRLAVETLKEVVEDVQA